MTNSTQLKILFVIVIATVCCIPGYLYLIPWYMTSVSPHIESAKLDILRTLSVTFLKNELQTNTSKSLQPVTTDFSFLKTTAVPSSTLKSIFLEKSSSSVKPTINIHPEIKIPLKEKRYIRLNFQGRLGNLLFQYASLYGIARHQDFIPVVGHDFLLRKIFSISAVAVPEQFNSRTYNEKKGCAFENEAFNLDNKFSWTLNGYFQSWKYFTASSNELRKELSFNSNMQREGTRQLKLILQSKNITDSSRITLVAVHVRRGDMVYSNHMTNYGYISADVSYLNSAMTYFQSSYPNVLFIVSSDDMAWCRSNLNKQNVAFVNNNNPPEVDMAILTQCNHTIVTTGSYGWWIAWLVQGKTIYYKNYPKPGSELSKLFNSDDYRPPNWIPM